ncbi:MAG TPA: tetratricopeptide repeat protein [Terriglobales bacterium]|nr:tetratricopeptide repeat protein [Terriglobales bacterium]
MRACLIIVLVSAICAPADTVYLKNGRQILADRVRQSATHVEYDIGDNSYAIPKSLVDHVDATGMPPSAAAEAGPGSQKPASEMPAFTPSVTLDDTQVAVSVIKDGRVDSSVLDSLDRSGNAQMAAAGYFLAGRHEEEAGHRQQAQSYLQHALGLTPENAAILTHYAAVLLQGGNYRQAMEAAQRATFLSPDSADAFTVLGFAQFMSDRSQDAVRSWKRSLQLRPDATVQQYLAKAQREVATEADFSQSETGHFTLRYEGHQTSDEFRRQLLQALDADYNDLSSQLDAQPRYSIPVVLYTEQEFFDVTQAPGWTNAINDGKLRIPVSGLTEMTPELARVLKHELAHSFINQLSAGRCPQWLHEGIAQVLEPRTTAPFGRRLGQLMTDHQALPFNMLEGSFIRFSTPEARLAYDESLAAAEYIRDTYGMDDLVRVLRRIAEGSSTEAALRATIHCDYAGLENEVGAFLQEKYGK